MAKREEGLVNLAELNHMLAALNAPVVTREREKARIGESGIGTKTTGRVFEAILGNEHWHQTNPRSRAHPPLAAKQLSITQRGHVVVDDAAAAAADDDDDDDDDECDARYYYHHSCYYWYDDDDDDDDDGDDDDADYVY